MVSATFAGAVLACTADETECWATLSTNAYKINNSGSITDQGAHGLGTAPSQWGLTTDGLSFYLSNSSTALVRKWKSGSCRRSDRPS